jgi:hypothetical protein
MAILVHATYSGVREKARLEAAAALQAAKDAAAALAEANMYVLVELLIYHVSQCIEL